MLHTLSLSMALAILWLLLSGIFEPLLLSLGVASVVLTVFIAHRMDVIDHEGHPVHHLVNIILYWGWLIKEIIKANWDVAKTILGFGDRVELTVFKTPTSQKTELDRVIYANSITLTPGTVTLSAEEDGVFTVHALTRGSRAGVESGDMDKRCTAIMAEDTDAEKPS